MILFFLVCDVDGQCCAAVTFYRGGTIIPSTDRGAALAVDITNKMKEDHIFRTCEVIKAKS